TNGLDPAGIADIRRLLPELAGNQGRAVLLSSHRMDEVDQVCDNVTIIHRGSIVASGETSRLTKARPQVEIICGDRDKASLVLEGVQGITSIERKGRDGLLVLSPGVPAAAINSLLVEAGIEVRQVMEKRESLEEVFFRLTGDDNDEK
ncbi:MAG TPA: hypothetical protein VLA34_07595, partial [Candidatus Krumholzibacterium sp.]|nr:hypothetical protein [Candidatus Krumholzibacterium sp.]